MLAKPTALDTLLSLDMSTGDEVLRNQRDLSWDGQMPQGHRLEQDVLD